ncbi:hypothetical protein [Sinomonas sp. RB5]
MESSNSRRPRRARLRSAILAALGVAVFGLAALPAQEAQAAGIVAGVRHVSAVEGAAAAAQPPAASRRDGQQA